MVNQNQSAFIALAAVLFIFVAALSGQVVLSDDGGAITSLSLGNKTLSFEGGFSATDVTNRGDWKINFDNAEIKQLADKSVCDSKKDDLILHAEFLKNKDYVLINGYIENLRKTDRAIILDYCLETKSDQKIFSNELNSSTDVLKSDQISEGNVYPVASLSDGKIAVVMAIPPSEPCIFGMIGSPKGLITRFYLGLSPDAGENANRASFAFIIYLSNPEWPFRSALDRYYSFYPEYYSPRIDKYGLWMFQMEGRTPANTKQYAYNEINMGSESLDADIKRDQDNSIITFPYLIVGQREIKFLDKLPADYDEAMEEFAKWSPEISAQKGLTKESVASKGDINLKKEVQNSCCKSFEDKYNIIVRKTVWGANSVTFKINPDPDLFEDKKDAICVGSEALELASDWLTEYPVFSGIYLDSLGRMWPSVLNYRRDHFKYTDYPLTFDSDGRIAIHNQISHYEFIETLRAKLRKQNKFLFGNGVYSYPQSPRRPEHYRKKTHLGRFFMASLLDIAGSEAGVNPTKERWEFVRTCMGKKIYTLLNYYWEDEKEVQDYINKALCYGILATNSRNFLTGVEYENNPDGYWRDKKLLDWFVPKAQMLCKAGWEPVTYAKTDNRQVLIERFGSSNNIYFSLYNDSDKQILCNVEIDLRPLGFTYDSANFEEIARGIEIQDTGNGKVVLKMDPKKAYIIRLTGLGIWG